MVNPKVQALIDAVTKDTTVEQSAITLMSQLFTEIQAGIDADDMNAIQQTLLNVQNNSTALAAAITANTPAPPSTGNGSTTAPVPGSFTDSNGNSIVIQQTNGSTPSVGDSVTALGVATPNSDFILTNGFTLVTDANSNVQSYAQTPASGQ